MLGLIRNLLAQVPTSKKPIVMDIFVTFVVIFLMSITVAVYLIIIPSDTVSQKYNISLQKYIENYQKDQQIYRTFLFYATKSDLIYKDKLKVDSKYIDGLSSFVNLNQQQCYQMSRLISELARQYDFIEIGNFQYDGKIDWAPYLNPAKQFDDKAFDAQAIFPVINAIQYHINREKRTVQNKENWFSLSKQQLIDCCEQCLSLQGTAGLNATYKYIMEVGLVQQKHYPYQNSIGSPSRKECRVQSIVDELGQPISRFRIDGYNIRQTEGSCKRVNKWLEKGPVVVAVDSRNWRTYQYGRWDECQRKLTGYALLVGRGIGYWKVRNSWGSKWGEKGFVRLKIKESQDVCGLCLRGSVPLKGNWYK